MQGEMNSADIPEKLLLIMKNPLRYSSEHKPPYQPLGALSKVLFHLSGLIQSQFEVFCSFFCLVLFSFTLCTSCAEEIYSFIAS